MRKYLLTVMLIFAVTAGAMAQDDSATKQDSTMKMSDQVKALQLASSLVKYGYANNSASSLIEAAKIIKENGFMQSTDQTLKPETETAKTSSEIKQPNNYSLDVNKLLADAKKLATGDKNLLALAESVAKSSSTRGVKRVYRHSCVSAYSTQSWTIELSKGSHEVFVEGDGDTDIDMCVYKAQGYTSNGNINWVKVDCDVDYDGDCYVEWYAYGYNKYKIVIDNKRGRVSNCYDMYIDDF